MLQTFNGSEIRFRGLLRKEVKALRGQGIVLTVALSDDAEIEQRIDAVFKIAVHEEDQAKIDDLIDGKALELYGAILEATYPKADTEKNSG
jgi:hypothetical protein